MLGICEQCMGEALNSRQKSIIDRCVRLLYQEIPDAIDQKAVVDIHICFMGEDVQGTADKQFQ